VNFAFAGTPDFAAWTLDHLAATDRLPCLVISQPDRPRGRGRRATAPPAAVAAARLGVPLIQPDDINDAAVLEHLRASGAKALVVASFGQILRSRLLDAMLCLNIHASLLPAYRGAAPIERALAAGEDHTGVTIIRITERLDSGPWALKTSLSLSLRDDAGSVRRALAFLGAQGVDQVLTGLQDDTVVWTEQEGEAVYAEKLVAADCVVDPLRSARAVHDQVRALSPRVGVRMASGGVQFKVWRTWPYGRPGLADAPVEAGSVAGRPGQLMAGSRRLFVGCGEGLVELLRVQPSGKNIMGAAAFLRGYRSKLSDHLDPVAEMCGPLADER
jgi:methionyl-tRNA formyltransferase